MSPLAAVLRMNWRRSRVEARKGVTAVVQGKDDVDSGPDRRRMKMERSGCTGEIFLEVDL